MAAALEQIRSNLQLIQTKIQGDQGLGVACDKLNLVSDLLSVIGSDHVDQFKDQGGVEVAITRTVGTAILKLEQRMATETAALHNIQQQVDTRTSDLENNSAGAGGGGNHYWEKPVLECKPISY